jgi:hypothetical protein
MRGFGKYPTAGFEREKPHESYPGRVPSGASDGSGRLDAGVAAGARAQDKDDHHNDNRWPYATTGKSPVLAVVGDIACQPGEVENGAIVEPTGEAAHELCSNPKVPLHRDLSVAIPGGHCE